MLTSIDPISCFDLPSITCYAEQHWLSQLSWGKTVDYN